MFIVPGILGAKLYQGRLAEAQFASDEEVRSLTWHYRCSLFVAAFGIFFCVASFVGIIKDMVDGNN